MISSLAKVYRNRGFIPMIVFILAFSYLIAFQSEELLSRTSINTRTMLNRFQQHLSAL